MKKKPIKARGTSGRTYTFAVPSAGKKAERSGPFAKERKELITKMFVPRCDGARTKVLFVVVLILTRIIKSVVTGQAPVTLELRNNPGKNTNKPKAVHAYITADAIHASTRNI